MPPGSIGYIIGPPFPLLARRGLGGGSFEVYSPNQSTQHRSSKMRRFSPAAILRTVLSGVFAVLVLATAVIAAEPPVAWQEDFNTPDSPVNANKFYEDRGSGKNGDPER